MSRQPSPSARPITLPDGKESSQAIDAWLRDQAPAPAPAPQSAAARRLSEQNSKNRETDDWGHEETDILRREWAAMRSRYEISDTLKAAGFDRSPKACVTRASKLRLPKRDLATLRRMTKGEVVPEAEPVQADPAPRTDRQSKTRPCLKCTKDFNSRWFGERICALCTAENAELDDGHDYAASPPRR